MPSKPKHPCNKPGCRALTSERFCDGHQKQYHQKQDRERGTAHQRGYGSRWAKSSRGFLQHNPLCKHCEDKGIIRASEVTDHIVPHRGDMDLFWDRDNWQPLCKRHHDIKTAKEDGGFGRNE